MAIVDFLCQGYEDELYCIGGTWDDTYWWHQIKKILRALFVIQTVEHSQRPNISPRTLGLQYVCDSGIVDTNIPSLNG